ncbi:MAG: WD domain, G-beta repeat [Planctomycetes bacterium ADurb.Bin126]|nr:MAG: WD domain, G-beta repeat [Planctomycetes bacterium ADurb.Bin126]HOD82267.1 WD40 repeat domain-containing protein [Phycisphaerae bacterium]HQL72920.1 WD40 repeat domain-containing protein [Phycisphaerae bacterium]
MKRQYVQGVVVAAILLVVGMTATRAAESDGPPPDWKDSPYDASSGILPPAGQEAPDPSRPMCNLWVEPVGDWLPLWYQETKVVCWDNTSYWSKVSVRVEAGDLDDVEALGRVARKHPELEGPIVKVLQQKRTPSGWYAVIQSAGGKKTQLVYVRKMRGRTVTCWARLDKPPNELPAIPPADAIRLAESLQLLADVAKRPAPPRRAMGKTPLACEVKPLSVLKGHKDEVTSLAFARLRKILVTGARDKAVIVWDWPAGTSAKTLAGHQAAITAVSITADGGTAASGDESGAVKLWEVKTGQERGKCASHTRAVFSTAFSPSGGQLISSSRDHSLQFLGVPRGEQQSSLYFTNGARFVACPREGENYITAMRKGTIDVKRWPFRDYSNLCVYTREFRAAAISPNGKWVAGGGECIQGKKGCMQIYDELGRMTAIVSPLDAPVTALAFGPDNRLLASGFADGQVKIWDAHTAQEIASLKDGVGEVRAVAFSPDGTVLAKTNGDTVTLWSITMKGASGRPVVAGPKPASGTAMKFTKALAGHEGRVRAMAFGPDGKTLLSGGQDGAAILWDVQGGAARRKLGPHAAEVGVVALDDTGRLVAVGDAAGQVTLWDAATGLKTNTLKAHSKAVNALAFWPGGKTLASAGSDNTVKVWEVPGGAEKASLAHEGEVRGVAVSADGKTMVTIEEYVVRVWDAQTLTQRTKAGPDPFGERNQAKWHKFRAIAVNSTAFFMATGGAGPGGGGPVVRREAKGRSLISTDGRAVGPVTSIAMTPKGDLLAAASCDGWVRVWKGRMMEDLGSLYSQQYPEPFPAAVALSPDGTLLAQTDGDKILLWRIQPTD